LAQFESQQKNARQTLENFIAPRLSFIARILPVGDYDKTFGGRLGTCPGRRVRVDDSQINYHDGRLFGVGIMGPWWFQDFKRPGMALNLFWFSGKFNGASFRIYVLSETEGREVENPRMKCTQVNQWDICGEPLCSELDL
jgi:hypothetical protein